VQKGQERGSCVIRGCECGYRSRGEDTGTLCCDCCSVIYKTSALARCRENSKKEYNLNSYQDAFNNILEC